MISMLSRRSNAKIGSFTVVTKLPFLMLWEALKPFSFFLHLNAINFSVSKREALFRVFLGKQL
jgi:hypothetical protein